MKTTTTEIETMFATATQYDALAAESACGARAIDLRVAAQRLRAQAKYWERRLPCNRVHT